MDICTGYTNRTLFLTGATGFVGKVAIFKILKEFPDVKRIYLLMRGKRSRKFKRFMKPQERLQEEVLGSPCFDPLRAAYGDAKWRELSAKLTAMNGDITEDHIGLSERDRATVAREVNLIIHLAATVNFNERLDLAVQMNTLGGLRVLSLAKTCVNLEAMVHTSTCYVNYRRQGRENVNEEKIYPVEFDPEGMCKTILSIHPKEIETEGKRLVKSLGFPNTYTFTKNMGEHLLQKYKGQVPLAIVRPSIIACSYYEPFPGWVDALTAAGGLILTATLGVVREFECRPEMTADVVPVDFVVITILKALFRTQQLQRALYSAKNSTAAAATKAIAAPQAPSSTGATTAAATAAATTAAAAAAGKVANSRALATAALLQHPAVMTMNAGCMVPAVDLSAEELATLRSVPIVIYQASTTGTQNRTSWTRLVEALKDFMKSAKRHPKAIGNFDLFMTSHRSLYLLHYGVYRYAPYLALKALASLPQPIGSKEKQEKVAKLGKVVRRADWLNSEFHDFVMTEWMFSCANTMNLDDGLNEASRKAFCFDPYALNWYAYTQLYAYGIFKNIVQDVGGYKCPLIPPSATDLFSKASNL